MHGNGLMMLVLQLYVGHSISYANFFCAKTWQRRKWCVYVWKYVTCT